MKNKLIQIFCEVDDFCKQYEENHRKFLVENGKPLPKKEPGLWLSEMMTIMILFHQGGFRNFKHFYMDYVCIHLKSDFPELCSYQRFVSLMGRMLIPLVAFQLSRQKDKVTGISFIDSTILAVCRNQRIHRHKVFKGIASRGKSSMGWFYGFKLHLIVNDKGEIISFVLSSGNVSDQDIKICKNLTKHIWGKLFGDRGYISQKLFNELFANGVKLITRLRKNMKNKLMGLDEKLLLRKRSIIETINDQLKNICQIEHTRHRSPINFLVNLTAGLIAYSFQPKKPSIYENVDNREPDFAALIQN